MRKLDATNGHIATVSDHGSIDALTPKDDLATVGVAPTLLTEEKIALVADGVMTVKEATAFSRLCRADLYDRMESGELPYVKIGKNRLIPRKALVELMAAHVVSR